MPIHGLVNGITHVYPPHFSLEAVVRPNILALRPYRCARDDYQSGILLDANENALGHSIPDPLNDIDMDLHRYPDPAQLQIKERIARLRGVPSTGYVFLGVGSDEVIDLLMRTCCVPGRDKILTTPPSYGMYPVCAQVNDVEVVTAPLNVEQGAFLPKVDEASKNSVSLSHDADS